VDILRDANFEPGHVTFEFDDPAVRITGIDVQDSRTAIVHTSASDLSGKTVRFVNKSLFYHHAGSAKVENRDWPHPTERLGSHGIGRVLPVRPCSARIRARGRIPLLGEGKVETGYRHGYYCLLFEDPDRVMIEIVWHDAYYFSPSPP
jgi:hypothetical protein